MLNLTVRYLASSEHEMWDEFVEVSPQGTIFSSVLWLKLSGMPFKILGCLDGNNQLIGGIAFAQSKQWGSKVATAPPLTPFLGILLRDEPQAKRPRKISRQMGIMTSIIKKLAEDYDIIHISNHIALDDIRPFLWNGYSASARYTYILDISDRETLWNNLHRDTKRDVRKALEHDIVVSIGTGKYGIYDFDRIHQLSWPERPFSTDHLTRLYAGLEVANRCQLYFAHNVKGDLISAAIRVWDKKRAYGLAAANHPTLVRENRGASHLLHQSVFEDLAGKFVEIDLNGANRSTIASFKRGFGGELKHYFTVYRAKWFIKLVTFGKNIAKSAFDR